jgi:hypothetical protein
LEQLLGTGLPYERILFSHSNFEFTELNRLTRKFNFGSDGQEYTETVLALHRFKRVLSQYVEIWSDSRREKITKPITEIEAGAIFRPIAKYLSNQTRECFSHNHFFGKVHFLLHGCEKYGVPEEQRVVYLKLLYQFPVIPVTSFREIVEHEIWPANLPHTFMHMAAGKIRTELERGRNHKEILRLYKKFLKELHIGKAHSRWFKTRLPGSCGSSQ